MESAQIEASLRSIQDKIVAHDFDDAIRDIGELRRSEPENAESLYMLAVCHRYQKNYDDALGCLAELKSRIPEHGRAHQEEGHTFLAMGKTDEALAAYARACQFNPALIASWRRQLAILAHRGMDRQAKYIRKELNRLEKLPAPLLAVSDLMAQGKLLKAEDICRQFLQKVPHNIDAMRLLADIGARLGALDDAEFLLESALKLQPENNDLRTDFVQVLRKRQKFEAALEQTKILLSHSPDDLRYRSLYAIECMQTGDYDSAISEFDRILGKVPGDPITLTSKGHALKTNGRYDPAVGAYRSAVESQPNHGEAWYSLANLKVYKFSEDEINRMRDRESDPNLSFMDRVYLQFALGKAFEDQENFGTAFQYYQSGNRLKKAQSRYDADKMTEDLLAQQRVCTEDLFSAKGGVGHPAPDPIFIVGLPRAGSTLLEQILSSHSQVDGTLELPNILSLSHRLRRGEQGDERKHYPEVLHELTAEFFCQAGETFIRDTRVHRAGAPFFIDKMPNNFRHIGLIHLILPNAKIIDARRHPMACCFSGFKQLFAEGQEFTYSLGDCGRYFCDYVSLMDHWDSVLPGKVLRVQYEDVVSDIDGQVRRILDFCELPFEQACIDFYKTDRSVRTPSSEQVRQPIYTSGLEQWRHFEPWLDPLKEALGPVLHRYPIN